MTATGSRKHRRTAVAALAAAAVLTLIGLAISLTDVPTGWGILALGGALILAVAVYVMAARRAD